MPHPPCGDLSVINPLPITLGQITPSDLNISLNNSPFTYNPNTNAYECTITLSNTGTSTLQSLLLSFSYSIFLDCSLIPTTPPTTNLQQYVLTTEATVGNSTATAQFNVPIPFISDNLVPSQMQAVPVAGNYAQQSDMVFEYINEGNAPITIDIMEFSDRCGQGYTVLSKAYKVGNALYTTLGNSPPLATNITLDPGEILYLKQTIKIGDCLDNVCNNDREIRFVWRCHNAPNNCQNCQHEYSTPFVFVLEEPHFAVEVVPNPVLYDEDDITCADPSKPSNWKIRIKNTSAYTTLAGTELLFQNPEYSTSFTYLKFSDINTLTGSQSTAWSGGNTFAAPSQNIVSSTTGAPCSNVTTVSEFKITTGEIPPSEYYEFVLPFYKCCIAPYTNSGLAVNSAWESYLNINKFYNQWTVTATATDICGNVNDSTDAVANSLIYPGTNKGISSHAISATKDINLFISHNFHGTDLDVLPSAPLTNGYTYGDVSIETMNFGGIMDDNFDKQALGIAHTDPGMNGVLRVSLNLKRGLVIADFVNDVSLEYTISQSSNPITIPIMGAFSDNPQINTDPPACIEATYDYYFKLDNSIDIDALFSTGVLHFTMTSCCQAESVSDYDVTFSLLNDACAGTAFPTPAPSGILYSTNPISNFWNKCCIPLGRKGFHKNVHCPGCMAPGIIVDRYEMFRTTFGFEDGDNDGMADVNGSSPTPIIAGNTYYNANKACMNLGAAILGDEVTDRLIAHFQAGDPSIAPTFSNCNERGYTYNQQTVNDGPCTQVIYSDMLNAPSHNIILNALQLYKNVQYGGCDKMSLKIKDATLYIDDLINTGSTVDENLFNISQGTRQTLFKIEFNSSAFTAPSPFYEAITLGTDLEEMFTFHTNDLCNNLAGYGTVTSYTSLDICDLNYLENQQYRMIVNYDVDGNTEDPDLNNPVWDNIKLESEIMNRMWLTGGVNNHGFELNNTNGLYWDFQPQMPNSTVDLGSLPTPLKLSTSTYCTGCAPATQSNMGDYFRFFCEPRGNVFRFYSSDYFNTSVMGNNPDGCGMTLTSYAYSATGRNNYNYTANGCSTNLRWDIFPYEFRAPKLLPQDFNYVPITNNPSLYHDDFLNHVISTQQSANVFSWYQNSTNITINPLPLVFGTAPVITGNNAQVEFEQGDAGKLHILTQQSWPPSNNQLWVSDNFFKERTLTFLDLKCQQSPPSPPVNMALDMQSSFVQFGVTTNNGFTNDDEISVTPYQTPANCEITGADAPSRNGGDWRYPNPQNISLNLSTPSIIATEERVCWGFTMSNPLTSGVTAAYNVYIQTPNLPNVFSDWELTFDYKNNSYSYLAPLQGGGYFTLFPTPAPPSASPDFVNFAAGVTMVQNGLLCARYTDCVMPDLNFDLNWGWNCTPDYNSNCIHNFTEHLTVTPRMPNIQVSNVTPPLQPVTLCSNNTFAVEFKNVDAGTAFPTMVWFGNNSTGFDPVSVTAINCANPNNGVPLTPNANNEFIISHTDLHDLGYYAPSSTNDGMKQGDCLRLEIAFTPTCQFGDMMQLPDVILSYNPFCNQNSAPVIYTVTAPGLSVPISGTACTDCFKIEKWATPGSITNGIEEVTYEIVVCANNDPQGQQTYTVDLADNFPTGFAPTLDPFNGQPITVNVPATGCVSTFASGYLNGDGCNHAEMSYTSSQSSVLLQADTCVTVLPNCRDVSDIVIDGFYTGDVAILDGMTINITGTFTLPPNSQLTLSNNTIYMDPGAEIVLQSGAVLSMQNCHLLACTKMWKGITLTNAGGFGPVGQIPIGATLRMTDCIVEDAEYAVNIGDYCNAILTHNYFYNDYISVYYRPLPGGALNHSAALITDNEFHGAGGSLALPYQGQTNLLGNIPKAGIEAWHAMINMTQPQKGGQNRFINLSNGIILQRSDLQIEKSWFDHIQPDAVYDNLTLSSFNERFNGSGIYGNGFKTNFMVKQKGLGTGANDPYTFNKCKYGIFVSRMEMQSSDNIMLKMTTGYHSRLATRRTIIAQNKINAYETAIELLSFDGANETNVWSNEITFGHSNGIIYPDWAIRAEGNLLGNDRQWINNNRINFNGGALSGYGGIYSNNCRWLRIVNNSITMDDNNNNNHGIYLTNFHSGFANCNTITGTADYTVPKLKWQSAITLFDGLDPEIACNTINATVNGIYVDGTINSLTTGSLHIQGNNINEHLYGLHYSGNATSPAIDYRGNLWLVQNLPPLGKHAINDNPINIIPFYVNSTSLPLLPALQYPTLWFVSGSVQTDFECHTPETDYCADNFPASSNFLITEPEKLAADETLENDPFTEETKWTIKKNLYEKVTDNPLLLSDTLMQQFYLSQQGTVLAALKPIDEGKSVLFNVDSLQQAWLAAKRQAMDLSAEIINEQLMLLDTAIVQQDSAAIVAALTALDNETAVLEGLNLYSDSLLSLIASNRIAAAAAISNMNAALVATIQIEDNEKKVNEIYLATLAKDVFEFTNDQMQDLYAIASQCPLAGGQAVYKARALYALTDKKEFFNNFAICEAAGYAMRKAVTTKSKLPIAGTIKIYPNPASESATLEYNLPGVDEVQLTLMGITGQLIKVEIIKGDKGAHTFSTKDMKPGVYQYKVSSSAGNTFGKLIIIR